MSAAPQPNPPPPRPDVADNALPPASRDLLALALWLRGEAMVLAAQCDGSPEVGVRIAALIAEADGRIRALRRRYGGQRTVTEVGGEGACQQ